MTAFRILLSVVGIAISTVPCSAAELTGRLLDAAGKAAPGRVYIRAANAANAATGGKWFHCQTASAEGSAIPYSVVRFDHSVETHTTISAHPFHAELPAGTYRVFAERGPEFIPDETTVEIGDGDTAEITLQLKRWVHMTKLDWFSGDTHVHRPIAELPNLLLAEDLNVALPLTYWVTKSGIPPAAGDKTSLKERGASLIAVDDHHVIYPINSEYEIFTIGGKRHTLGAIFVLNHKEPLPVGAPPVKPIARLARAQGALLDLDKHNWPWSLMLVPVMEVDLFELTNNHVWRTGFGFKAWQPVGSPAFMHADRDPEGWTERGWIDFGLDTYYLLLNCGFRMRPSAGTASGVHPVPLGFGRVYVHQPDGFSYQSWIKGLDAGNSFVTTGPMIDVRIDDTHGMGSTLAKPSQSKTSVAVTASWPRHLALDAFELVVNGKAIPLAAEARDEGEHFSATATTELLIDGTSWIAARIFTRTPAAWRDRAEGSAVRFAHSSPIWIDVQDKPLLPRREGIAWLIQRMSEEITRNTGVLSDASIEEYREALNAYQMIQSRLP